MKGIVTLLVIAVICTLAPIEVKITESSADRYEDHKLLPIPEDTLPGELKAEFLCRQISTNLENSFQALKSLDSLRDLNMSIDGTDPAVLQSLADSLEWQSELCHLKAYWASDRLHSVLRGLDLKHFVGLFGSMVPKGVVVDLRTVDTEYCVDDVLNYSLFMCFLKYSFQNTGYMREFLISREAQGMEKTIYITYIDQHLSNL